MSTTEVRPVNIGPRGRRQRLAVAVGMALVTAGGMVLLVHHHLPHFVRIVLFAPLFVGALGLFQAQASTCVVLAARGRRDVDDGEEAIEDPDLAGTLRRQAKTVWQRSLLTASLLTFVLTFLPV